MKKAIYPGSFNPIHEGHLSTLVKALKLVDFVYVVVSYNDWKEDQGNLNERFENVKNKLSSYKNVKVLLNKDRLTTDIAKELNVQFIIRSGRNNVDFQYERDITFLYKKYYPEIEVIIIMPDIETIEISSSKMRKLKHPFKKDK